MDISVVIPLLNENESLPELHDWIASVMQSNRFSYELIFIDDGSTDDSWQTLKQLAEMHSHIKAIRFQKNFGKSQALHAGFNIAQGDVVITMDADLQDSPDEIPELYTMITTSHYDIISGWKKKRYDNRLTKNIPSKLFNWAARKTSGIKLNDFNSGLKAYKKTVIKHIDVYGEMHRYIPVLAKNAGFTKIGEKVVTHRARKYGKTKFGAERFINGFLDLITIWFISRFGKQPMHLFGILGVIMFGIGLAFALYLGVQKVILNPQGRLITERPQFYIALVTMIIGTQFFIAGFIGELVLRSQRSSKRYLIKESFNVKCV